MEKDKVPLWCVEYGDGASNEIHLVTFMPNLLEIFNSWIFLKI